MSDEIISAVKQAHSDKTALSIMAGGSKAFYGPSISEQSVVPLDVTHYAGVLSYEPTELVVTARCGTKLSELNQLLAEQGQCLPFEPPSFSDKTTVGGMVAAGLSGPRRAYAGSVRDFVLGTRIVNGQGQDLRFGGQVMKNVAGFDLSRLMVGALGTLGVILEVSFKLLPQSKADLTLQFTMTEAEAITAVNQWAGSGLPISASCYVDEQLMVRFSGFAESMTDVHKQIGGEILEDASAFWLAIQDQTDAFFQTEQTLWRIAVPPASAPLEIEGKGLIEWGGAQRWLLSSLPAEVIRAKAAELGGHASIFRNPPSDVAPFTPLPPAMAKLQSRIKEAMDPHGILNPGKINLES